MSQRADSTFRFPAEFEKHEAIWLNWPVDEPIAGLSQVEVHLEIIKNLISTVTVKIAMQNEAEKSKVEKLLQEHGISQENIKFYLIGHDSIWVRDFGAIYMRDSGGNKVVQMFGFNGWGYSRQGDPEIKNDSLFAQRVAQAENLSLQKADFISEGGGREFNGQGTMITVEACELGRNRGKTKEELEKKLLEIFHLKKVIWLKQGLYEDDLSFDEPLPGPDGQKNIRTCMATGGHVDEFCRFVDESTVVVAEVTEEEARDCLIAKENRRRLEENIQILQSSRDQNTNPLKIIRIPLPEPIYNTTRPGDALYDFFTALHQKGLIGHIGNTIKVIAAASYNNFLITNDLVLMPRYWKPGLPNKIKAKDEKARQTLEKIFPERKVVAIDALPLNYGGGGIHCVTQQEPGAK